MNWVPDKNSHRRGPALRVRCVKEWMCILGGPSSLLEIGNLLPKDWMEVKVCGGGEVGGSLSVSLCVRQEGFFFLFSYPNVWSWHLLESKYGTRKEKSQFTMPQSTVSLQREASMQTERHSSSACRNGTLCVPLRGALAESTTPSHPYSASGNLRRSWTLLWRLHS